MYLSTLVLPVASTLGSPFSPLLPVHFCFSRFHPTSHSSFIILSLHVILGLPLFPFSAGIQCSACLVRLTFSICCTWSNHLSLHFWSVYSSSEWSVILPTVSFFTLSFHSMFSTQMYDMDKYIETSSSDSFKSMKLLDENVLMYLSILYICYPPVYRL